MSRQTGSVRFHNVVYPHLKEHGPMSTHDILDWVNNRMIDYRYGSLMRTKETYTVHQVSQILRTSKWFRKTGGTHRVITGGENRAVSYVYEVAPMEEVLEKILAVKHHYQDPEKTMPKFAKEMYAEMKQALEKLLEEE